MRRCFRSKLLINCWFLDCWFRKPNFCYELMDLEDLRIPQSRRFTIPRSERFMDSQILNVKKLMWILDFVKLPNCIIWNTRYKLSKNYRPLTKETPSYTKRWKSTVLFREKWIPCVQYVGKGRRKSSVALMWFWSF